MRNFILLLILLSSFLAKAQDSILAEEHSFCGVEVLVPPNCQFENTFTNHNGKDIQSGARIKQGSQFVNWSHYQYLPEQAIDLVIEQNLTQLLDHFEKNGGYNKKAKKFISLNQELSGWLIELNDKEKKNTCFFFASGVINSEHILIYCGLSKKPKNNKSIPDFVRQIIQFK